MKIKYNLEKNYFNLFNEAQGIGNLKKEIERDPYKKVLSYTAKCLSFVKITLVILVFALIFYFFDKNSIFTKVLLYLLAFVIGLLTIMVIIFIASYLDDKKRRHSGEIQFSKNGILDVSDDGIKIGLPWNYIDFVVVTDSIICILTKTSFIFYFDNEVKDKIIDALAKYAPDIKIYNQGTTRIEIEEKKDEASEKSE